MPSTITKATKSTEATAPKKKLVKKNTTAQKDTKTEKSSPKAEKQKSESPKTPKAKKEKTPKEPKAESATESAGEESTPKKKKSINVKPTLGDTCGLNLSVAKIKNIISNNCINKEAFDALQILKSKRVFPEGEGHDEAEDDGNESADADAQSPKKKVQKKPFTFTLADVPPETLAYLDRCYQDVAISTYVAHSREVIKGFNEADKTKYTASKNEAVAKFEDEQRHSRLFRDTDFDLIAFNKQFKSNFYKGMKEEDKNWKSYKDMALYDYCVTILNKTKTRFNSEAKIYITALVEFIIKQLIINGTKECVNRDKKIIKVEHAITENDEEFTLFPFIKSTAVYKTFIKEVNNPEETGADTDDLSDAGDGADAPAATVPYKHYIGELCRNVRMELSAVDKNAADAVESRYNQTSVSKKFKQFCSDAIIELLEILGNAIKVEVSTRNVKTVNYAIIYAVLYTSHVFHNVPIDDTIAFIQDKYNTYNDFLKKREKRSKTDTPSKVKTNSPSENDTPIKPAKISKAEKAAKVSKTIKVAA
jgi:hypothetical protein